MSTVSISARRPAHVVSRLLAVFLVMHGIAHFVGVTGTIGSIREGGTQELAAGAWSAGNDALLALLAVLWAVAGAGFVVTAALVWLNRSVARAALLWVASFSLALSALTLWAAVVGVVINVVLIVAVWLFPSLVGAARSAGDESAGA